MTLDARERLIVALDLPSVAAAEAMVTRLGDSVCFYKIGYQLAFAGGLNFAAGLIAAGKQVFLDLKLHDIGNTVQKGVESVAQLGATFLTVHAYPQTMKAAVEGKRGSTLRILAVTVLTSYDDADLAAAGYDMSVGELVAERAGAGARHRRRRPGLFGRGGRQSARHRRPRHGAGDAGHPAGGQRLGRPEAHHDAGARHRSRRRLSGGRPAGGGSAAIRRPRPTPSSPRSNKQRERTKGADMAKGYWIANVDVRDADGYKAYVAMLPDIFRKYGGRYTTRGGRTEVVEGKSRSRIVVIEFPSFEAAMACYRSPEYAKAIAHAPSRGRRRPDRDRGLRRPAALISLPARGRGDRACIAPLYPPQFRSRSHGRHAACRRRCRRAHGPHAGQGDRRQQGSCARGRGGRRALAADRPGCRRAGGPRREWHQAHR